MDTWTAIRSRRNVKEFKSRPIERDCLVRILDAGRRSPSALNRQAWDFVVVTERAQLVDLAGVWKGAWHVAGAAAAVGLVVPVADDPQTRSSLQFDLGQAALSMQLAATDLGIGCGHGNVGDQDLARRLLDLPEDRELARILDFGYPADRPLAPVKLNRRPLDDLVHWGHW